MFIAASDALMNVMVEDLGTITERLWREVSVEAETLEMLLFQFLQEFIFYKDAEQLLLRAARMRFKEQKGMWMVTARAYGEMLDPGNIRSTSTSKRSRCTSSRSVKARGSGRRESY